MNLSGALTETWLHFLSLFLSLHHVPSFFFFFLFFLDREIKEKEADRDRERMEKGNVFLPVLEYFPSVFSLIPLNNRFSWSCPFPFAFHMCEQWILVAAQLVRPSRLAPYVHHCAVEVAVLSTAWLAFESPWLLVVNPASHGARCSLVILPTSPMNYIKFRCQWRRNDHSKI